MAYASSDSAELSTLRSQLEELLFTKHQRTRANGNGEFFNGSRHRRTLPNVGERNVARDGTRDGRDARTAPDVRATEPPARSPAAGREAQNQPADPPAPDARPTEGWNRWHKYRPPAPDENRVALIALMATVDPRSSAASDTFTRFGLPMSHDQLRAIFDSADDVQEQAVELMRVEDGLSAFWEFFSALAALDPRRLWEDE